MNTKDTIVGIISNLFEVSSEEITMQSSIGDFPKWDSLGHMTLMTAVQNELDIEFEPEEMIEIEDVEDIVKLAEEKLAE